jgi:hypothetical protein
VADSDPMTHCQRGVDPSGSRKCPAVRCEPGVNPNFAGTRISSIAYLSKHELLDVFPGQRSVNPLRVTV